MTKDQIISQLKQMADVVTDPNELKIWGRDWTRVFEPNPLCAVFPRSTKEVAQILRFCNDNRVAVVPSGGRTGLVAGAVASNGEVVLSLEKMKKIHFVDTVGLTISCEAGVTTEALQEAARDKGLMFALDLAAKGSCHVGGNVATNAGGVKLIRYGGAREQVLGIEVVLANGEILNLDTGLRKNNSGYDLKQLFIGSEGTLGVVTNVTFKLVARPKHFKVALLATDQFAKIARILEETYRESVVLTAFEFFTGLAHTIVLKHQKNLKTPFDSLKPFYVLLEIEEASASGTDMEDLLEKLFEKDLIQDGVIAMNSQQFRDFWALRENITESLSMHGQVRKNDISLAVKDLPPFLADLEATLAKNKAAIEIVLFGHIGDGNLHLNYVAPKERPSKEFHAEARAVEVQVFQILEKYKGSISAEHGIGLTKKEDLHFTRTEAEISWMKKLKALFDPNSILNPGKIF